MLRSMFLSLGGLALVATATFAQAPPAGDAAKAPLARLGSLHFRHGTEVTTLAYSANGQWLASGGADDLVHIWNTKTGQLRATLKGHTHALTKIEFFPDHERLLTASLDGTIRLWQIEPVKEVKRLVDFTSKITSFGRKAEALTVLALARDGKTAVLAGPDRVVRVWDFAKDEEVKRLTGHDDEVVAVAISPDGKYVASSAKGASVLVWDLAAGRKIHAEMLNSTNGHPGAAFSPDGKTLAIAVFKSVRFFDVPTMRPQPAWRYPPDAPDIYSGLMYSHHGHWLLTYGGFHHGISAYGVESKAPLRALKVDLPVAPCWSLSPDSKVVALAPRGGDIVLWDLANGKMLNPEGHVRPIEHLAFSGDGKTIFTCAGAEARAWDAASGKVLGRTLMEAEGLAVYARAEGGAALLPVQRQAWQQAEWDGSAAPRLGRKIEEGFGFYRGQVAVSSRGRWLAVVCGRNQPEVVVWDVRTGQTHKTVPRAYGDASLLFAPDERFLGQLGGPNLHLYDFLADASTNLRVADGFREVIRSAAFSADSRLAALAVDADVALARPASPADKTPARGRLFCLELTTQQIRYDFPQFKSSVEALAVSPDGRHLAVAAEPDHTVHLLDMHTGAEVCRFAGHRGRVLRLAFSREGHRLASASADTTALVWDVGCLAQGKKAPDKLAAGELEALWQALTLPGGPRVHEAIMRLSQHPGEVVPYLKARFKQLKEADPKQLVRYIKDLDDEDFAVRERATRVLAQWIDAAAPLLRDVVAKSRSPEAVGRARLILADYKPRPEHAWREFRAVEVLEKMAVPAARDLLKSLAEDAPTSSRAREAQAALNRLRS